MDNKMKITIYEDIIMANKMRISLERHNVIDMVINESKKQKEKQMKWHIEVLQGVGVSKVKYADTDIFFCQCPSPVF